MQSVWLLLRISVGVGMSLNGDSIVNEHQLIFFSGLLSIVFACIFTEKDALEATFAFLERLFVATFIRIDLHDCYLFHRLDYLF